MQKMYHIATPEQLTVLNAFAKEGNALNLAAIWTSKLRKDGKTPWDNDIFAIFSTDNGRKAFIGRKSGAGLLINVTLKYTPALKYCAENLKIITE